MFCPICKAEIYDDDDYCPQCGNSIMTDDIYGYDSYDDYDYYSEEEELYPSTKPPRRIGPLAAVFAAVFVVFIGSAIAVVASITGGGDDAQSAFAPLVTSDSGGKQNDSTAQEGDKTPIVITVDDEESEPATEPTTEETTAKTSRKTTTTTTTATTTTTTTTATATTTSKGVSEGEKLRKAAVGTWSADISSLGVNISGIKIKTLTITIDKNGSAVVKFKIGFISSSTTGSFTIDDNGNTSLKVKIPITGENTTINGKSRLDGNNKIIFTVGGSDVIMVRQ
ncbi:MAG: zinc ribbon domain-containing protein [Oscillospiraceae bacterium]|jgi:hypothetical protein|nr:zinc ribbon domain-containing protein [Oscillospiraceae bacterium]